jgi:hypothetical protein
MYYNNNNDNSVTLIRGRTIPTERPSLVGEACTNFCVRGVSRGHCGGSLRPCSRLSRPDFVCMLEANWKLYIYIYIWISWNVYNFRTDSFTDTWKQFNRQVTCPIRENSLTSHCFSIIETVSMFFKLSHLKNSKCLYCCTTILLASLRSMEC